MKKGKKKNNIIDRAKSNMEKNRKEQKVEKFFGVLLKYLNTFRGRFGLLVLFTTIGFAVIIGRVYQLQTKGGEKYRKQGEKQYTSLSFIKQCKNTCDFSREMNCTKILVSIQGNLYVDTEQDRATKKLNCWELLKLV